MKSNHWLRIAGLSLLMTYVGCGSSGPIKPTDEQNAFASVEGLGDLTADDQMFAAAFVAGAAPDNRKDYSQRGYQVNGEPTVAGDQLSVPVKIFGVAHATESADSSRSKPSTVAETEQVWTLQRVDGQWKLKDAPLG